jgi:hypothetical protein
VPRYAVHLDIRTDRPLKEDDVARLSGGRHEVEATGEPRRRTLVVDLVMDGGDVVGALARALNVVLDAIPGVVRHAEVTEAGPRPATRPSRRRGSAAGR